MIRVLARNRPLCLFTVLLAFVVFACPEFGESQEAGKATGARQDDWRGLYKAMFGARFQQRVSDVSDRWRVSLTAWNACPDAVSNTCFLFAVEESAERARSEFKLANETAQVDAVDIIKPSRTAILGRAMHNMYVITLVQLPSGSQLDRYLCYWPALSPDRRFVAYEKFSPAHPGHDYSPSAEYLVYDLMASPKENRTLPNRERPLDPYNVGWPVFPEGVKNTPGDNILEGRDTPVHWMASEGFFWLERANTVAFVDRWQGVNRLVLADVSGGIQRPNVSVHPVNIAGVVDLPGCKSKVATSDYEGWIKDPATLVHVTDIGVPSENPGSLRLRLQEHACVVKTSLDIRLSPGANKGLSAP